MRLRKQGGIRNEAPGLGPAAIEAEVVNLSHSATSDAGREMLLALAPSLKCCGIQVGVLGRLVLEETIERLQSAGRFVETTTKGPFQIHVPLQDLGKPRRKLSGCFSHRGLPVHRVFFPEPEEKLHASPRSPVVDKSTCSLQNDAREHRR